MTDSYTKRTTEVIQRTISERPLYIMTALLGNENDIPYQVLVQYDLIQRVSNRSYSNKEFLQKSRLRFWHQ